MWDASASQAYTLQLYALAYGGLMVMNSIENELKFCRTQGNWSKGQHLHTISKKVSAANSVAFCWSYNA